MIKFVLPSRATPVLKKNISYLNTNSCSQNAIDYKQLNLKPWSYNKEVPTSFLWSEKLLNVHQYLSSSKALQGG